MVKVLWAGWRRAGGLWGCAKVPEAWCLGDEGERGCDLECPDLKSSRQYFVKR